jgi:hypothetical protein
MDIFMKNELGLEPNHIKVLFILPLKIYSEIIKRKKEDKNIKKY